MSMMIPLFKVDEARREVIGRAVQEIPDKSGEILDYESSKENFRKWSEEIHQLSGGKSYGNLRSMHGNTAAGKLVKLEFNDAEKAIDVVAKITDDNEWKKVVDGVYTGFSIGGGYAKRWPDPDDPTITRYTAKPTELSLVDNPCIPSARFYDLIKLDGSVERREIKPISPDGAIIDEDAGQPLNTTPKNEDELRKKPVMFADLVKTFDESKVNRDDEGKFAPKGPSARDAVVAGLGAAAGAVAGRRSAAVRGAARQIGDAVAGFQAGLAAGRRGRKNLATSIGQGVKSAERRAAAGRKYDASLKARSRQGPGYSMGPGGEAKAMREVRDKMGVRSAAITGAVAAGGIHNVTRRDQKVQQQDDGNRAHKAVLFNEMLKFDESKVRRDEDGKFAPKSGAGTSGADTSDESTGVTLRSGEIVGGVVGSTAGSEAGHQWGKKQGFDVARRTRGLAGTAGGLIGAALASEVERKIREASKTMLFNDLYKNVVEVDSYTREGPDGQQVEVRAHTRGGGSSDAGSGGSGGGSSFLGPTAAGVAGTVLGIAGTAVAMRTRNSMALRRKLQSDIVGLRETLSRTRKGSKRNQSLTSELEGLNKQLDEVNRSNIITRLLTGTKADPSAAGATAKSLKQGARVIAKNLIEGLKSDIRNGRVSSLRNKAAVLLAMGHFGRIGANLAVGNMELRSRTETRDDGSYTTRWSLYDKRTDKSSFLASYDSEDGIKTAPMGALSTAWLGLVGERRPYQSQTPSSIGHNPQPGSRTVMGADNPNSPESRFHPSRNNQRSESGIQINPPVFNGPPDWPDVTRKIERLRDSLKTSPRDSSDRRLVEMQMADLADDISTMDWTDMQKSRAMAQLRFGGVNHVTRNLVENHIRGRINRFEKAPGPVNDVVYRGDLAFIDYAPYIPNSTRQSLRRDMINVYTAKNRGSAYGSASTADAQRAAMEDMAEVFGDDAEKSAPVSFTKAFRQLSDPDLPLKKAVSLARAVPPFPGEDRQTYVDRILLTSGI